MPNPALHRRRSLRLKGYDYSQSGLYFVTICCQNNVCRFGTIVHGEMILNDAGEMIEKWCAELSQKFPDIELDRYVIMPNHYHAIIVNNGTGAVGAHLRVRPNENKRVHPNENKRVHPNENKRVHPDENKRVHPDENKHVRPNENILGAHAGAPVHDENMCIQGAHVGAPLPNANTDENILGEHKGSPLHSVVQWFKTMTTNEYIRGVKNLGWQRFYKKLWQRNYWEHIIRSESSYQYIANYIVNNPANWEKDKFY